MKLKKLHSISGLIVAIFIMLHLTNHISSIWGSDKHIEVMNLLRPFYRNIIVETILLLAILVQVISGLKLFVLKRKIAITKYDKLQIWSGLYLAIFLAIHLSAVFGGRHLLNLDTNFYFGVAGLNTFPFNLFFIPYYALAIIAFFGHIASIHNKKMSYNILGLTPSEQSKAILIFGVCLTIVTFFGLTKHFEGVKIPPEYNILIGK